MKNKIKSKQFKQLVDGIDKEKFIYIDESGIKPNIIRDYGWAPKGEKIFGCRKGKEKILISLQHLMSIQL